MKKWNDLSVNMKRVIITLFAVPLITGTVTALTYGHQYGVNQDVCTGCGVCWETYPNSFQSNDDGKAEGTRYSDESEVKEAQKECPVGAIWTNF